MNLPKNIIPLIDADWMTYMCCSAVEYSLVKEWKDNGEEGEEPTPSFQDTIDVLKLKIEEIKDALKTEAAPIFFYSGSDNFREGVAISKAYKGSRDKEKPYLYEDLKSYIKTFYIVRERVDSEADDILAMEQEYYERHKDISETTTCIVTVDKDLRQVNGWHYTPEGWNYGSFGPVYVTDENSYIELSSNKKKIIGTGWKFFYAQLLVGDNVDDIPGCPSIGPAKAFKLLENVKDEQEAYNIVLDAYKENVLLPEECLLEQARLLWMVREVDGNDELVMWNPPDANN